MQKVFVKAQEVRQGDTLCFGAPVGDFLVERVTRPTHGRVVIHALNDSHRFFYEPTALVRVLLGSDRAVAGHDSAAIEADLAIARMKQSGRWDAIRSADANQHDFQAQFSRSETLGLWA